MTRKKLGMVIAHLPNLAILDAFQLERAEFTIFEKTAKTELVDFIEKRGMQFGVHCPLFVEDLKEGRIGLLASLVDGDEERRKESVELMARTVADGVEIGAGYAVVHIQRPENFGGENPVGFDADKAFESASRSCERLLGLADGKLNVNAENLFRNRSFYAPESYSRLLDAFPSLGFCLDIGHLEVDSREFGFPFDEFLDAVIPRLRAIHLQNSNPHYAEGPDRFWKVPVHPSHKVTEGWLDIEFILRSIISRNRDVCINFETHVRTENERTLMREGVAWIKELLDKIYTELDQTDSGN